MTTPKIYLLQINRSLDVDGKPHNVAAYADRIVADAAAKFLNEKGAIIKYGYGHGTGISFEEYENILRKIWTIAPRYYRSDYDTFIVSELDFIV